MRRLFRQFSFPGGIPSHVAPETPGSIHEGGELGYALLHAYGAAFDNPDLLVCCVVGDGEAETGPLAASWHSNKFLNPARDGAVLPILHLNGYKIANPTVLARIPHDELRALLEGYGYAPRFVEGDDPAGDAPADGRDARRGARRDRGDPAPRPRRGGAAALADDRAAHAEGLDRPEGGRRASRPRARSARTRCRSPRCGPTPSTSRSSRRGCAATGPRSCSTTGAAAPRARRAGARRASGGWAPTRTPTAACCCATWSCPTSATTRSTSPSRRRTQRGHPRARRLAARRDARQPGRNFRVFGPDETASNRLGAGLRGHRTAWEAELLETTITWRPTAASWRSSPSTSARAGSRATC